LVHNSFCNDCLLNYCISRLENDINRINLFIKNYKAFNKLYQVHTCAP
jgi:predicted DNA-binding helix-hairpin-helix protein